MPTFVLVTEPQKQRLFFTRQDGAGAYSVSTKIKLTEQSLEASVQAPCCKDSPQTLQFNRQNGELRRTFSSGGVLMQCEKLDDSQYEEILANTIKDHNLALVKSENQSAAKQA